MSRRRAHDELGVATYLTEGIERAARNPVQHDRMSLARRAVRLDFVSPAQSEAPFLAALREQARDFGDAITKRPSAGATANDAARALRAAKRARLVSSAQNHGTSVASGSDH